MSIPIDYALLWNDASSLLEAGRSLFRAVSSYVSTVIDKAVNDGVLDTPFDVDLGRELPNDWLGRMMAAELAGIGKAAYGVQEALASSGLTQGFSIHDDDPNTKALAFRLLGWKRLVSSALSQLSQSDYSVQTWNAVRDALEQEVMRLWEVIDSGNEAMRQTATPSLTVVPEPADDGEPQCRHSQTATPSAKPGTVRKSKRKSVDALMHEILREFLRDVPETTASGMQFDAREARVQKVKGIIRWSIDEWRQRLGRLRAGRKPSKATVHATETWMFIRGVREMIKRAKQRKQRAKYHNRPLPTTPHRRAGRTPGSSYESREGE